METHSPANESPESDTILEDQLRDSFGRVVYSHKTHEKSADILLSRLARIKIFQIVLSALAATGGFSIILGTDEIKVWASFLLSTVLLILNLYARSDDLGGIAQRHRDTGSKLWVIREKYTSLIADLKMRIVPIGALTKRRDDLMYELSAIYKQAPSTNHKAYRKAQEALKKSEEMTFSDTEIDDFLPEKLKKER